MLEEIFRLISQNNSGNYDAISVKLQFTGNCFIWTLLILQL